MKFEIKIILTLLALIANFEVIKSDPFDDLTVEQKSWAANNITGGIVPIKVNGVTKPKAIFDTINGLKEGLNQLKILATFNMVGVSLTNATTVIDGIIKSLDSIQTFKDLIPLNYTIYQKLIQSNLFASSSTVRNAVLSADWTIAILTFVNFDTYVPNLDKHKLFWVEFGAYLQKIDPTFFTAASASITQKQINIIATTVQVPDSSDARQNLYGRIYNAIKSRPTLINEFEQVALSYSAKWNSSQLGALKPIIKDMNCFYLRKIDLNILYSNWMASKESYIQLFEKLSQCSLEFVYTAMKLGSSVTDENLRASIGDNGVKYMLLLGINDPLFIINIMGPYLPSAPATTIDKILSLNHTAIKTLFKIYNVKNIFASFKPDWRRVIALAVQKYFIVQGTSGWDSDDIDMFTTTALYMDVEYLIPLMDANNNYQKILPLTDNTPISFWNDNCFYANLYFDYLAKKLASTGDPQITLVRLQRMLVCKENCDFSVLINGKSVADIIQIIQAFVPFLKTTVVAQCKANLANYLKPSTSNIANYNSSDLALILPYLNYLYTPSEIQKFSSAFIQSNYGSFATKDIDIDFAKEIFKKLPPTVTVSTLKNLLKGASFDYLASLSSTDVASNIIDFIVNSDSMELQKLTFILNKYLSSSSNLKTALLVLFQNPKSNILNLIQVNHIRNSGIKLSDLPVNTILPKHLTYEFYKYQNVSVSSLNVNNVDSVSSVINGININDIINLKNENRLDIIMKLLKNVNSMDILIRKKLLSVLIDELKATTDSSTANPFLKLSDSMISLSGLTEFFVEIGSMPDVLNQFVSAPVFKPFLMKLSQMQKDKCETISRSTLQKLAQATVVSMGLDKTKLTQKHLDTLGPILVSSLPIDTILQIDYTAFASRLDYFKSRCFQLKALEASKFSSYLSSVLANVKLNASNLAELVIYLSANDLNSLDKNDLKKNALYIIQQITKKKDLTKDNVKVFAIDFLQSDRDDILNRIKVVYNAARAIQDSTSTTGKRKRQTTSPLSCSSVANLDSALTTYSVDTLKALPIDVNDLNGCLISFGKDYGWDSTYLSAFYNLVKSYYSSVSSIPSNVITNLGVIACQFSTSELSSLNLASKEAVFSLGRQTCWSSAQLTALAASIKASYSVSSSDTIQIMGNLVCGLSDSDVASLSASVFNDVLSAVSNINIVSCSNIKSWFQLAKTSRSSDIWENSVLTSLGAISAGMTDQDFKTNILDSGKLSSLTPSALNRMPAVNLNQINSTVAGDASPEQASAIVNSIESKSLSSTLTSAFGVPITTYPTSGSSSIFAKSTIYTLSIILFSFLF